MNIQGINFKRFVQSCLLFQTKDTVLYADPLRLQDNLPKADIILITHHHDDHCSKEDVEKIKKENTVIIAPKLASEKLNMATNIIEPEKSINVKGIEIRAVQAYNINKFRQPGLPFHPKGDGVGYVFSLNNTKIYVAGDTDFIPEMKTLNHIDIAFLPIGGTYTMDVDEAVQAVSSIKPKMVVPIHYGVLKDYHGRDLDLSSDVESFKMKIQRLGIEVKIISST